MNLENDLVVLDLETTGVWIEKDKIVEIAMIKLTKDGKKETFHRRCNPGILIPPEVVEIIGITNEDVADEPPFKEMAHDVVAFIGDCDLGGYNHERFDLPLLQRELSDAGVSFNWQKHTCFDAQRVFHFHEKRDLTAAYKKYCDKDLVNAHSALADTQATLEILEAQTTLYGGDANNPNFINGEEYQLSSANFYGSERKFRWWNKELYPMFGKYARKWSLRQMAQKDPSYMKWILKADFSEETKTLVQNALDGHFPSNTE